jgi:hypothetical protein
MRMASPFTRATISGRGLGRGVTLSIAGGAPGSAEGRTGPGDGEAWGPAEREQPATASNNHRNRARFFLKKLPSRVELASLATMERG